MKTILDTVESPEAEAMKARVMPWWFPLRRIHDTYWFKARYYNKPEGEDLLEKLVASNRIAMTWGFAWGIVDSTILARKQGYAHMIGRLWFCTWPAAGAATAFTTTAYFGAKLREKDDFWNYLAGAVAAGSVIGGWQRNHVMGWSAALLFCVGATLQRVKLQEGWDWMNFKEGQHANHRFHKFGWTIFPEGEKGYTTTTDEI